MPGTSVNAPLTIHTAAPLRLSSHIVLPRFVELQMVQRTAAVLAGLCLLAGALALQQQQTCTGDSGCLYQRPAPQPQLHMSHPRLSVPANAGPHDPEQAS
jgi:hypothetical protein